MNLIIEPDAEAACAYAAALLADYVRDVPNPVLGLATGRTMERVYAQLAERHASENLDFSACTTFNLDEYAGVAPSDPHSYRTYMEQHFFRHIAIPRERTNVPLGIAENIAAACAAYEDAIRTAGGIGLQLLGIGATGHIGFNEPLSSFASRTRLVMLDRRTRQQNAEMFGGVAADVPEHAVTMGVGTIMEARRIVLLATGPAKAAIVATALQGPITAMISATALHFHPDCTVILDEDAAATLSDRHG
jgi:glucosamine-6-phosphate deaminase